MKDGLLRNLNGSDNTGRGKKRVKEERGERRDEVSEKMKKLFKKWKMKRSLKDASLASLGLVFHFASSFVFFF